MSIQARIDAIFPRLDEIPSHARLPGPVEQQEYLVGGRLARWEGPTQEVLSPICAATGSGPVRQRIGSFPLMTEAEALAALDAAVLAYDEGRGKWPTMPVAERIGFVQEFARRMKERRAEVVRILMWEIGKPLQESEKEFDRTVGLHRRYHRCPQGAGPGLVALCHRAGNHRPDPSGAARRDAVHGPIQLPAERNLHHADPGADHGQHGGLEAAKPRGAALHAAAGGVPRLLPARRDQHRLRRGPETVTVR